MSAHLIWLTEWRTMIVYVGSKRQKFNKLRKENGNINWTEM